MGDQGKPFDMSQNYYVLMDTSSGQMISLPEELKNDLLEDSWSILYQGG